MINKKRRFMTTMHLFLGLVVLFAIFNFYLSFLSPSINPLVFDIFGLWLNNIIIPYGIGLPIFWLIVRRLPVDNTLDQNLKLTKIGFIKLLILQLGFTVMVPLIVISISKLIGFDSISLPVEYGNEYLIYSLFLLLLFNPLVEEVLFRKMVLGRLLKWGEKYAIIISSIFFAFPHLFSQGIAVMFSTLISGYIWGYVTVKTGKITPAVLLHSLSNFFGVFFPMMFPQTEIGDIIFVLIRVLIIPLLAIFILIREWKKKDFFVRDDY